jgi:dihydroorotase-like cyclic amidohydrolase
MIAAKGKMHVDVAFWGGVVPGNQVSCVHSMHFTA